MTLPTNTHHLNLLTHLRELLRRCDALGDFHLPWRPHCGRVRAALTKLDFEIRWEIDRAKWEQNWLAERDAERAAAAFRTVRKRAKTIALKKQLALAESGK